MIPQHEEQNAWLFLKKLTEYPLTAATQEVQSLLSSTMWAFFGKVIAMLSGVTTLWVTMVMAVHKDIGVQHVS